jgi:transcription antitermination factor NusG
VSQLPPKSSPNSSRIKWVIVELTSTGEKEDNIQSIIQSAHKLLKKSEVEVFVPAISQTVRDDSQTMFYMSGYVFIEYIPGVNYLRLRETTYFRDVLCNSFDENGPQYSLLDDSELDPIRKGMDNLKVGEYKEGDAVIVKEGCYRNLPGVVSLVYEDKQNIQVAVNLLSKKMLIDFPVTYVEKR